MNSQIQNEINTRERKRGKGEKATGVGNGVVVINHTVHSPYSPPRSAQKMQNRMLLVAS